MADKSQQKKTPGRWYMAKRGEVHDAVKLHVDFIRVQQQEQRREARHFLDLYSSGNVAGLGSSTPRDNLLAYLATGRASTRFNLSAAICDTAVSMIAHAPAVPQYMTTGGDFSLMRKAEKRSQVLQSQINNLATDLLPRAFLDATKVGSGFIWGYLDDDGVPALERVHMNEIFVEHADGINGNPRSIHRVYLRSKELLKAKYGEKFAADIEKAPQPSDDTIKALFLDTKGSQDMVEVYESYHLRSIRDRKRDHDGRHTVCLANVDLLDEKYEHDQFPCEKVDYRERDFGYFGSGLVEATRDAQVRVNELIATVARGQNLGSTLIVANPDGGDLKVKHEQISNELMLIMDFDSAVGPPQLMKWDGTLDDLQQQIDLEFERVLMVEGLSAQQVNGEGAGKGLSGVAVRASDDVQSRRLVSPTKRFQSFCIGVAKLLERLNDDAVEEADEGGYEVRGRVMQGRRTFLQSTKWEDLAIPVGQADIVMAPMSALPTTPQGKWAAVQEWIGSGFVSKQYAMSLLQFPDIDAYADVELAHLDMAQWQIEQMLEGKSVIPFPRQDLMMAQDLVTKSELKAIMMGAPPEVVDAFESFLVQCSALIVAAQPPAPPPQMGPPQPGQPMPPGAPPPGQPMPAPIDQPVMQPRMQPPPMRPGVAA
jgi:hypothetical protein